MLEPLAAAITVGNSTGEGNSAISSRLLPATSGRKASTNALASAGVLYIFQLAAISFFRDICPESSLRFYRTEERASGDRQHIVLSNDAPLALVRVISVDA